MFIPLKMVLIGIDPYPYMQLWSLAMHKTWPFLSEARKSHEKRPENPMTFAAERTARWWPKDDLKITVLVGPKDAKDAQGKAGDWISLSKRTTFGKGLTLTDGFGFVALACVLYFYTGSDLSESFMIVHMIYEHRGSTYSMQLQWNVMWGCYHTILCFPSFFLPQTRRLGASGERSGVDAGLRMATAQALAVFRRSQAHIVFSIHGIHDFPVKHPGGESWWINMIQTCTLATMKRWTSSD
jgi:hypothetical protein